MFNNAYGLDHVFSFGVTLRFDAAENIGATVDGLRGHYFVDSGFVEGPRLNGTVRRGTGGDWLTIRRDGMGVADVRLTFAADDGALIYAEYGGLIDFGQDGYQRALDFNFSPAFQVRIAPRFKASDPKYLWLTRSNFLGVGVGRFGAESSRVDYDVYLVR